MKHKPKTGTDLDQFAADALAFVTQAVPDATFGQQTSAAANIVETFRRLFDTDGHRE